jgi:hypothetical protein
MVAAYAVPPTAPSRFSVLFALVVLDYFLGVGHTWDRQATLETIANCRLFYVCGGTLCTAALYAAWQDRLLNA